MTFDISSSFPLNHYVLYLTIELRNGTACKEEILQLVCGPEEVLVIHQAFFDGRDTEGCGFLMPINISTLLNVSAEDVEPINTRRFSVQSSVNRR